MFKKISSLKWLSSSKIRSLHNPLSSVLSWLAAKYNYRKKHSLAKTQ